MKMKHLAALGLCVLLTGTMTGCGSDTAVYVQPVSVLAGLGGIAPGDKFLGMVVSEHVSEIQKDTDKTVEELKVKEGDDVKKDQELFSYDTEELQLNLDKQRLELEQLNASIENYKSQIKQLEKERNAAGATLKLQYTVEIQTMQVDLKEAELKIKAKETEVAKSEDLLENSTVLSPVDGRVQAINESGTDNQGKELPYITIQQVGSYRIKGVLGELQRGSLLEGSRVRIVSRTKDEPVWGGTVTLVDYESPTQGSQQDMYYGNAVDEMSASSKYPFYVKLDSTEGLILGQHVYLELETEGAEGSGISIGSAFVVMEEDGTAYVWAESGKKLQKRAVTLGAYNEMADTYEILGGLTEKDYIAFPDPQICREGAPTTHSQMTAEELPAEEFVEVPMEDPIEEPAEELIEEPVPIPEAAEGAA